MLILKSCIDFIWFNTPVLNKMVLPDYHVLLNFLKMGVKFCTIEICTTFDDDDDKPLDMHRKRSSEIEQLSKLEFCEVSESGKHYIVRIGCCMKHILCNSDDQN